MGTIEIAAKSVEEAVGLAATQLGVPESDVVVTVLQESKGLFGKGAVRVRAEVRKEPEAKPARKSRKAPAAVAEAPPEPEPTAQFPAESEDFEASTAPEEAEEDALDDTQAEEADATPEDSKRLVEIVNEILRLAGLDAHAKEVGLSGRYVNLELDGQDVGYLIGKRGEVLNSFQYLLNTIAGAGRKRGARVVLDGQQYRTRREAVLRDLALSIADQVKERGEEAVLDALPAFERRVVHQTLAEVKGVATYSEGEEPARRVVIAPAEE